MIDKALLRPGRFDDILYIPLPDYDARISIIKLYTSKLPIEGELNYNELSKLSNGLSGAEIECAIKEVVMNILRNSIDISTIQSKYFIENFQKLKPSINEDDLKIFENFMK